MSLKYGFNNIAASMKCAVFNYFASVYLVIKWLDSCFICMCVHVCVVRVCVLRLGDCVFVLFFFFSYILIYLRGE